MALQALFPTTANIVPYYRPIHAEKIVILQKQNFARYKYQRYFVLHLNTAKFPMRLPLLPFLDERMYGYVVGRSNEAAVKPSNIIAKLHSVLSKVKPRSKISFTSEATDYNYKFEIPSYKIKSCSCNTLS